jgi:hypothetical protein
MINADSGGIIQPRMTFPLDSRVGPYEIFAAIGAGRMGKFTAHAISNDMEMERSKPARSIQKHSFTRQGIALLFFGTGRHGIPYLWRNK